MIHKKLLLIAIFLISSAIIIRAQDEGEDSTGTHTDHWKNFKWEMGIFDKNQAKSPTIAIDYGFAKIRLKDLKGGFEDPRSLEIKLGYTTQKILYKLPNLIKQQFIYGYLANISTDLTSVSSQSSVIKSSTWKFGVAFSNGYGYRLGEKGGLIFYNTSSIDWSRLHLLDNVVNPVDRTRLDMFNDSFRFGTSFEGGVRINITPLLTIDGGYQKSIVFQRHLFWKWAGSTIIELVGQGLIDQFINEISDSSPAAVPIVNFVLKNGLAYGLYQLRYDKMNWPFKSAPPLTFRQYKFGITLVF